MISCSSCGASLDEGEQFCPACGAATPLPPMPDLPPEFFGPDTGEEPAPAAPPKSRSFLLYAIAALCIVVAGGLYAILGNRNRPPPEPEPTAYTVELPQAAQPVAIAVAPTPTSTATPEAKTSEVLPIAKPSRIEPGLWRFETELYDVTSATLGNPINDIARFPLRRVSTVERCITPQIAAAPASVAFPVDPADSCSVERFSMLRGAYRATMRCAGGAGSERSDVEIGGEFDATSAQLTVHTSMMAADLSPSVVVDEPIVSHASLRGKRIGSCRD